MNASMNDTHNLGTSLCNMTAIHNLMRVIAAWKLAYVLRGWADMSLLKTVSCLKAIPMLHANE